MCKKIKKYREDNEMLKKHIKRIGVLLITLSLLVSTTYAVSLKKTIDVYYDNIKIFVNDSYVNPKDGTGKTVEPFIYDGTTYLPVRAVAEALGKDVSWDGTTKSVYISDKIIDNIVWLNELYPVNVETKSNLNEWKRLTAGTFKDSLGNISSRSIECSINHSWLATEYRLGRLYSKMSGKFALSFTSKGTKYKATLNIYGDEKLLYSSPEMTGDVLPVNFDINIANVNKLRFEVYTDIPASEATFVHYGLIDVSLEK